MTRLNGKDDSRAGLTPTVGRAAVVHPILPDAVDGSRTPDARLEEAVALARSIGLDVAGAEVIRIHRARSSTLLAKGAVERLSDMVRDAHLDLIIVDAALTPVQQRNLERILKSKVIDRTGLILEIFGARARTYESRLQVELAALTCQRTRLVRSWTHLERQRGGHGFVGGPGERQIEMDRRIIGQRINKLERDLAAIRQTRTLHRRKRQRVPYPVIALVGYTNAGKSTLFNQLVGAGVLAKNMLFATLDPTLRQIRLPSGRKAILGDTVGFVSELPTQLVAAFRATLEDVSHADLIVHVRDVAHPDSEAQKEDVLRVLGELAVEGLPTVEVLNKSDLLSAETLDIIAQRNIREPNRILASSVTGMGCDDVLQLLDRKLSQNEQTYDMVLSSADGAAAAWLYRHGHVLERVDEGCHSHIRVTLDLATKKQFEHRYNNINA